MKDETQTLITRPAAAREIRIIKNGNPYVLDLALLIMAAARTKRPVSTLHEKFGETETLFTCSLLKSAGIMDEKDDLDPEDGRNFLEMNRHAALLLLMQAWRKTNKDDLRDNPLLTVDESVEYDPVAARTNLIRLLSAIPHGGWWSMDGFSVSAEKYDPEFLHRTGNAGDWLVQNSNPQGLIGNSDSWLRIENSYMNYMISGPLFLSGLVDIAWKDDLDDRISAFRINRRGTILMKEILADEIPTDLLARPVTDKQEPVITVDGKISVTNRTSRMIRYQTARYCEWEKIGTERCTFRVTPKSLTSAKDSGLSIQAYVGLLKRICGEHLPDKLVTSVYKWEKKNIKAVFIQDPVLTVQNAATIDALIKDRDAGKWIMQRLNPTTVLIKAKGIEAVRHVLAEMEILSDLKQN